MPKPTIMSVNPPANLSFPVIDATNSLLPDSAISDRKFLVHLHEAYRHGKKFGITRKDLRKFGFFTLASLPFKGEVLYFDFGNLKSSRYLISKRFLDLVVSFLAILLLIPIGVVIAIIVLIDVGWPIFYFQRRLNHRGEQIFFIKFRSMQLHSDKDLSRRKAMEGFINGEKRAGSNKIINETLVSTSGKFLRKYSLDELPQVLCVLIGSMSLVGPRPCMKQEFECYKDWHKLRLLAKPGCTGLWQVFGRSIVSFDESVLMDIYYSTQQDLLLDFKLIFKTIPVMVLGKGGA